MGGLELILIALLPLALLAALPDSRSDDDGGPEPVRERAEDDPVAAGDLLDLADDPPTDAIAGPDPETASQTAALPATAEDPLTEAASPESQLRTGATLAQANPAAIDVLPRGGDLPSPEAAPLAPPGSATEHDPAAPATPPLTAPSSTAAPPAEDPSAAPPTEPPSDSAVIAAGSPEFAGYMSSDAVLGSPAADSLQAPPDGAAVFANGLDGLATAGNRLDGGAGDDTLLGGAGSDTLTGGAGENVIRASYDPNLELAQGSDLFCWRDNGLPDVLEGGSENDRLIFARGDTATGGGGSNVFEVWHDPHSPQPAALITDFTPGQDRLDIVIRIDEADHPDCGAWAWDRQVQASVYEGTEPSIVTDVENDRTEIRLGNETLARLLGTPPLTPADLRLFAFWDITT